MCFLAITVCAACALVFHGSLNFETYLEQDTKYLVNGAEQYIVILLFLVLSILMAGFLKNISSKGLVILSAICVGIVTFFSVLWIGNNKYLPLYDQRQVWDGIQNFAHGTYEWIDPWYYRIFPFQMGIVVLFWILLRVIGICSVMVFRIVNVIAVAATVGGLIVLTHKLFHRNQVTALSAILLTFFSPLVLYTSFIYGTLISLSMITWSFILLIGFLKDGRVYRLILLSGLIAIANTIYGGSNIATIALVILLLMGSVNFVKKNRKKCRECLLGVVLIVIAAIGLQTVAKKVFTYKTGVTADQASPAAAIILMGITSDGKDAVCGPGSYDALTVRIYEETGQNKEKATKEAIRQIKAAIGEYITGQRNWSFFLRKIRNEWTDPWFSSMVMTVYYNQDDELISPELQHFLSGNYVRYLEVFLSAYITSVYLLSAVSTGLFCRKKEKEMDQFLVLIYFLGGFVFYIFWESKARYSLSYFVFLIPFACDAIFQIRRIAEHFRSKTFSRVKACNEKIESRKTNV